MTSTDYSAGSTVPIYDQASTPIADKCGIVASLACAVHCMAAPLLLLISPAAGMVWSHPSVHWILAALVLPLAIIVIYRGYQRHQRRGTLVTVLLGCFFILLGLILPEVSVSASTDPVLQAAHSPQIDGTIHSVVDNSNSSCVQTCCPSIKRDEVTGATSISFPPGSIMTVIGSVFLVLAHSINLYGSHCLRIRRT